MIAGLRTLALACALAAAPSAAGAQARLPAPDVSVDGVLELWATLHEEMPDLEGLYQTPSHDPAATSLTGLSLAKARVGVRLGFGDTGLALRAQARLDHDPMLLDAWAAWRPARAFGLRAGQMKVPGTAEALADDASLDFVLRSEITTALADYGLARSDHTVSLLYGAASQLRDLGVAVEGETGAHPVIARWLVTAGNGLGAGLYFGGQTRKEYFISNAGQLYVGARVELEAAGMLEAGAFASRNRHDDIVFNSGRTVYDLDRLAMGGDLTLRLASAGLKLTLLGGRGEIRDDFNGDGRTDLVYSGWAASAAWDPRPLLRTVGLEAPEVGLAARLERMEREVDRSGLIRRRQCVTVGLRYAPHPAVALRLDVMLRSLRDPGAWSEPDDDATILSLVVRP